MEVRIPKIPKTEKYKTFENNKQHYQVNPMYCSQRGAENFDSRHHTALQCGQSLNEVALAFILHYSKGQKPVFQFFQRVPTNAL